MNQAQAEERLIAIKDIPFEYAKRMWTLKSWTFNEDSVTLLSNGKPIEKKLEALDYFLDMLKPIERDEIATIQTDVSMPVLMTTLRDMLLDDIQKIRKDRDYCQQAKAVNNNINTIINLARFQLRLQESNHLK